MTPTMHGDWRSAADDLLAFIDASPSPFHAVDEAARRLVDAGVEVIERDGALVAWSVPDGAGPATPFRVVGAHTDSPNLRVRPKPDTGRASYRQLAVEIYGGVLLNSWIDRDLGLSGRVVVRGEDGNPDPRLFRVDRPLLRVPQLAIHLDREINQKGLLLNPQHHVVPVWGLGTDDEGGFVRFLAEELGVAVDAILAWDAMTHDLTPSSFLGRDDEFLSAPRLDNLCSCWAGVQALAGADGSSVAVLCLFDHEEVGSVSERGAVSPLLGDALERSVLSRGGGRAELLEALSNSICASADMAHAAHPNYLDRYEPGHLVAMNGGPVIKSNANQRYATDARSAAAFKLACERADVPVQEYSHRSDLPCGSTIGPLTAANLGMSTVDVGAAQLAMHSAREMAGSRDPAMFAAALTAFLS